MGDCDIAGEESDQNATQAAHDLVSIWCGQLESIKGM
jgi:hypothetical protein